MGIYCAQPVQSHLLNFLSFPAGPHFTVWREAKQGKGKMQTKDRVKAGKGLFPSADSSRALESVISGGQMRLAGYGSQGKEEAEGQYESFINQQIKSKLL